MLAIFAFVEARRERKSAAMVVQREAQIEAEAELQRESREREARLERFDHVDKFGHYAVTDDGEEECLACPPLDEDDGYPDCDEYCGQLGCPNCGDEARENLREQQLIFAQ